MWWKKNKRKVIVPLIIVAILAAAFFFGGDAADTSGQTLQTAQTAAPTPEPSGAAQTPAPDGDESETGMLIDRETGKDAYLTDPVPTGKPAPVEPQDTEKGDAAYSCTISISCADVLSNIDDCAPETVAVIPKDGWMLRPVTVTFTEGESVFDVLQRVCRENNIHMEYSTTAGYNSAYIEGIGNLYEFDAGELSGWLYSVNGWFPNYGSSRYQLKSGDTICWVYSIDRTSYGAN
ncbi:MAG: DUF4430 domain-containing protein [Oscillospiraceae bacterium]